jgi:hypothetical protein
MRRQDPGRKVVLLVEVRSGVFWDWLLLPERAKRRVHRRSNLTQTSAL